MAAGSHGQGSAETTHLRDSTREIEQSSAPKGRALRLRVSETSWGVKA